MRFHVLPEESEDIKDTLESINVGPDEVRTLIDKFLRGAVEARLEDYRCDERIKQQMDRRIEVAVKEVVSLAEREMLAVVREHIKKAVLARVEATSISVRISLGDS